MTDELKVTVTLGGRPFALGRVEVVKKDPAAVERAEPDQAALEAWAQRVEEEERRDLEEIHLEVAEYLEREKLWWEE